jgi:hypothetical protein
LGKGAVQVLGDVPTFRERRTRMLQDRYGLEFSAEYRRNFGESQVDGIEGDPLVRQCIADAPHEGARRTAVRQCELVQADFAAN